MFPFLLKMKSEKGVSLLEILVAAIIMALVVAGMANIFIAGKRHIFHSRYRITGGELGRLFLEPLAKDVRQDTWSSNCLGAGSGCPTAATVDNVAYTSTYTIGDVDSGNPSSPRKVKVKLEWNEAP